MSLENHPNFHSIKFVTDIMVSYHKSIRGKADKKSVNNEKLTNLVIEFVGKVEDLVDESAEPK